MRIALIHQDLFFQGGEYVVAKLANGLAARGHEVHVIVSKVHTDIARQNPEAKPFRLASDVRFHVLPFRRALLNIVPLAALLWKINPDVMMPNVGHYLQCSILAKIIGWIRKPVVYVEHNFTGRTMSCFNRFCLNRCRKIVAVSEGVKFGLVAAGAQSDKVVRIYNPILSGKIDAGEIHPWLAGEHPFTFVSAGALTGGKGFLNLIQAFSLVHEKMNTVRLLIFGRGPQYSELARRISECHLEEVVTLAGFTDCLRKNMAHADGFAFASKKETFSIVLVEALAAGLPVVSTDCPVGPREVLCDGALGQLVPVDDVDALAVAMLKVIRGEWKAAKAFDPSLYENDAVIARYEKLLMEIVHP